MTKIYSLLRIHVPHKTDIRYSLPIKSSKFSAIYTITAFFSVKTHNLAIIQYEIPFFLIWRREYEGIYGWRDMLFREWQMSR